MAIESGLARRALDGLKTTGLLDSFASNVRQRLSQLVKVQGLTPEFTSRFLDLTRQGMVPEIVVGHFNHLDPIVASDFCHTLIRLAKDEGLGENLRGFVVTLARSVPNGRQSMFMQEVFPHMEAYANERAVELVPITRGKDVERYGMKSSIDEKRPLVDKLKQKGIGTMILAGGSVQPGRHPEGASGDEIFGLHEIKDTEILVLFDKMKELGKGINQEPYFLPLAVNKTYRLYSSDSLLPTPEGIISLNDALSRVLGLLGFERVIITVTPTMPLTSEDMAEKFGSNWRSSHSEEAIDFLMTEIARGLPYNARGYYGKFI